MRIDYKDAGTIIKKPRKISIIAQFWCCSAILGWFTSIYLLGHTLPNLAI